MQYKIVICNAEPVTRLIYVGNLSDMENCSKFDRGKLVWDTRAEVNCRSARTAKIGTLQAEKQKFYS